jgi:hypothetical protein
MNKGIITKVKKLRVGDKVVINNETYTVQERHTNTEAFDQIVNKGYYFHLDKGYRLDCEYNKLKLYTIIEKKTLGFVISHCKYHDIQSIEIL